MRSWASALAAGLASIAGSATPFSSAAVPSIAEPRQIFGVHAPEDLEVLPGGRRILISEMADDDTHAPGTFGVLEVDSGAVHPVAIERAARTDWGEPACQQRAPADLSPHGIHLGTLPDGHLLLLAINHGESESVHAYEVVAGPRQIRLLWRGCVNTTYNFNDVASTVDGFIGSHQFDKADGQGPNAERTLFSGQNTGYAVRWSAGAGFQKVAGTEAAFPNGVNVSADGKTAFLAVTAARQVRKIDLTRNVQVAAAAVPLAPDNLSWTAQGDLLVTGAEDVQQLITCAARKPPCSVPFAVARVDPVTLKSRVVFRNEGSQLLGASVAVITGGDLYLGSFTGNHILKARAPALSTQP